MKDAEIIKVSGKVGKTIKKAIADKKQRMDALLKKDFTNERPVKIIPPKGTEE